MDASGNAGRLPYDVKLLLELRVPEAIRTRVHTLPEPTWSYAMWRGKKKKVNQNVSKINSSAIMR